MKKTGILLLGCLLFFGGIGIVLHRVFPDTVPRTIPGMDLIYGVIRGETPFPAVVTLPAVLASPDTDTGIAVTDADASALAQPSYFPNRDSGLANFYEKLLLLKNQSLDRVRVMQFGDSVLWFEGAGREIRAGLQKDFGDGGRGQIYMHQDYGVALADTENLTQSGFTFFTIPYEIFNHVEPKWLPAVGYSGWTYQARSPLAQSATRLSADTAAVSRLTLVMRKPPYKSETTQKVTVSDPEKDPALAATFEFKLDPAGTVVCEASFPPTRSVNLAFGDPARPEERSAWLDAVLLETPRGVSFSSFIHKGRHMAWMTAITPDVFEAGYKATQPDLLIFQYGINEGASIDCNYFGFTLEYYEKQLRDFFGRIRKALPETCIMLIGPYERMKDVNGTYVTYQAHDDVRLMQASIAREMGFCFFDAYLFFGGAGQLPRMIKEGIAGPDYSHLSIEGYKLLGNEIYRQMANGYALVQAAYDKKIREDRQAALGEQKKALADAIARDSLLFVFLFLVLVLVCGSLYRYPYVQSALLLLISVLVTVMLGWWGMVFLVCCLVTRYGYKTVMLPGLPA